MNAINWIKGLLPCSSIGNRASTTAVMIESAQSRKNTHSTIKNTHSTIKAFGQPLLIKEIAAY